MAKKEARFELRTRPELKKAMAEYSKRHDVSMSELVTRFFENLLEHEKRSDPMAKVPDKFF